MADQKTVIDWGEFEAVPSITPGPGAGGTGIKLPSQVGRGGFENVLGDNLRAGFADLVHLLTLPSRFGPTAFNYSPQTGAEMAEAQRRLVSAVGPTEGIAEGEGPVQRIVGGAARALPSVFLPGPKGATLFTKSPREAGEALVTAAAAGGGFEAGALAGEGSAFEPYFQLSGALTGGLVSGSLYNFFTGKIIPFASKDGIAIRNKIKETVGEENFKKLIQTSNAQQMEMLLKENPDLLKSLDQVDELKSIIPGFNPNLYQATGATTARIRGKAALERTPAEIAELEKQTRQSQEAVRRKTAELFPVSDSSFVFATRQKDRTRDAIAGLIATADDDIQRLSNTFIRTGKQNLGERIRASFEGRKQAVNRVFQDQYSALDDEAAVEGVELPPNVTGQLYNFVQGNRQAFENSPELYNLVQTVMSPRQVETGGALLGPTGQPLTPAGVRQEFDPLSFADLRSLSRRVNADFYNAQKAVADNVPGAGPRFIALRQFKEQVDNSLEQLPDNIKDQYKALNAAYDQQYREVFKKGLGGLLGKQTRMGEAVADEDIFLKLTKESNVDDFYRIFGNTPESQQFLTQGIVDKFLSQDNAITAAGVINQEALRKFVLRNQGVIDKVPSLRSFFDNAEAQLEQFVDRKEAATLGLQALEKSALSAIAKKQDLNALLTTSQQGVFQDLGKLSQLISSTKSDPTGRSLKGLQGLMIEKAFDSTDAAEFVNKNKKAFQRAFGDQFNTVDKLTTAMQLLGRNFDVEPPVKLLEGDTLQQLTGSSVPNVMSVLRDRISSVPQKVSILLSRLTQARGLMERDKAFLELYKNPDLARQALKYSTTLNAPNVSPELKKKALAGLYGVLTKAGVNLYRTAAVTTLGNIGEEREQEQADQTAFDEFETVE
jgi:hypothetical protein